MLKDVSDKPVDIASNSVFSPQIELTWNKWFVKTALSPLSQIKMHD